MLGNKLKKYLLNLNEEVIGIARKNADYNLDIKNGEKLIECFKLESPDVIINTASIVDIEFCEKNKGEAYLINSRPSSIIADYCYKNNIYFVQISTDHYYTKDKIKLMMKKIILLSLMNMQGQNFYQKF